MNSQNSFPYSDGLPPETVNDLVARTLAGDLDAFAPLVDAYQVDVWRLVAGMVFNFRLAEELVQQTFIAAYSHLGQFNGGDFRLWIRGIARNAVRMHFRTESRRAEQLGRYLEHRLAADEPEPELSDDGLLQSLERCKAKLPKNMADALDLRYNRALEPSEIASLLNKSNEAVRQLLFKCRLVLRDCILKEMVSARGSS